MTQSLVSRPQPNSVERRHGLHDNFNTLYALSVTRWLHARSVLLIVASNPATRRCSRLH